MSINRFFQDRLGANVKNPRWSWGAIDPVSNRVFLRVWDDQIEQDGNGKRVQIYWKKPVINSHGLGERLSHIEAIRNGAKGIGVVCRARHLNPRVARKIAGFQESPLLRLGRLTEDDAGIYARIVDHVSINKLVRVRTAHSTLTQDIRAILSTKTVTSTTKEALVDARVGQGAFRSAVLQLWNHRCSVTGSSTLDAIRASHVKPWKDSNNSERLDPHNGLPLVASLDALFDAGLISFETSGRMIVSSSLSQRERKIHGVVGKKLIKRPSIETADFLLYHRTNRYRK